jgi:hypothetical protein
VRMRRFDELFTALPAVPCMLTDLGQRGLHAGGDGKSVDSDVKMYLMYWWFLVKESQNFIPIPGTSSVVGGSQEAAPVSFTGNCNFYREHCRQAGTHVNRKPHAMGSSTAIT